VEQIDIELQVAVVNLVVLPLLRKSVVVGFLRTTGGSVHLVRATPRTSWVCTSVATRTTAPMPITRMQFAPASPSKKIIQPIGLCGQWVVYLLAATRPA